MSPDAEVVVTSVTPRGTASERTLDRAEIEALPGRSADDYLRAMPGLHLSAHGGRGKAYQYFLRGFDAVHGGDLAVSLEGVPINEVSNVHAHGYLDLQFIPTVLVRGLRVWPGAARAEAGDFAVAGSADFSLGLEQGGGLVSLTLGSDRSAVTSLAWQPTDAAAGTFVVAEADVGAGVGMARDWRQARVGAGVEGALGSARVRAWLLGYYGTFDSPGVLRADDLEQGTVSLYDAYEGSGGGTSARVLGAVQARGATADLAWQTTVFGGWRDLALQQNFTGWYVDPEHGDGTLQTHEAWSTGASARVAWSASRVVAIHGGVSARVDGLTQREDGVLPDGRVWERGEAFAATQGSVGLWLSAPLQPTAWLRLEPGLRADVFLIAPHDDALAWGPAVGPKITASLFEGEVATGFLSYGRGLRSPDARGVSGGGRAPVAVVDTAEAGLTSRPLPWLSLRAAGFATFVSDEIVFDHVAARFIATGSTRRVGVDAGVSVRPMAALRVDADLTWSDGRYTQNGEAVPYAPRLLGSLGLYVERLALGRAMTLTAGLRTWALGPRPLTGGFTSRPSVVTDLTTQLDVHDWVVTLDIDNLFATPTQDGAFAYASRWDPTGPRSELSVQHITAGASFAARFGLGWRF